MTATFELAGQELMALNGGPSFTFAQGVSLSVNCETQEEVDELWEKLSEGGEKGPAGGSRTGSASRGRSILASSERCWVTRIPRKRTG
jgi:predicted 3-demethylubiquinone-9 3-methyltransferase (glyoxalase superfamily)